jgi:hypothetical protein
VDPKQEELCLCWVADDGTLHHYYNFKGVHTEHTHTGDSFVLFRTTGSAKPEHTADIEEVNIVAQFRGEDFTEDPRFYMQLVSISTSGVVTVVYVQKPDDEYRVIVRPPCRDFYLPRADKDWTVEYKFLCPQLPDSPSWEMQAQGKWHTFYVWGDMDFDDYGAGDRSSDAIHPYLMNQIVPQVMTGRVLAGNDNDFNPKWENFTEWVIQAQYYWQTDQGEERGSKAFCGSAIKVQPGDEIHTQIGYRSSTGSITVSIGAPNRGTSELELKCPFPNSSPPLFSSWRDFFEKCQESDEANGREAAKRAPSLSKGPLGRPGLCVEYKGDVDIPTLRSISPFDVTLASFPGSAGDNTKVFRAASALVLVPLPPPHTHTHAHPPPPHIGTTLLIIIALVIAVVALHSTAFNQH